MLARLSSRWVQHRVSPAHPRLKRKKRRVVSAPQATITYGATPPGEPTLLVTPLLARREVVMGYLVGLVCVLALGVMPLVGCSDSEGTGGAGATAGKGGSGGAAGTAEPSGTHAIASCATMWTVTTPILVPKTFAMSPTDLAVTSLAATISMTAPRRRVRLPMAHARRRRLWLTERHAPEARALLAPAS